MFRTDLQLAHVLTVEVRSAERANDCNVARAHPLPQRLKDLQVHIRVLLEHHTRSLQHDSSNPLLHPRHDTHLDGAFAVARERRTQRHRRQPVTQRARLLKALVVQLEYQIESALATRTR